MRILVTFAASLIFFLLVGCGSTEPTPTAAPPKPTPTPQVSEIKRINPPVDVFGVPENLTAVIPSATASWIGPAGGVLTTQTPDGTRYELAIPAGAVLEPTTITMTPISAINDLGLSGGLAGAVFLQPSGLQLAEPATLRISSGKSGPVGTRLVGFDLHTDGNGAQLVPAFADGVTAVIQVFHFSAPGAGFGTSDDLANRFAPPTGTLAATLTMLLQFDVPWGPLSRAEANIILLAAWSQMMEPELQAATSDADLMKALADWRQFIFMLNLAAHGGDTTAALAEGQTTFAGGNDQLFLVFTAGQSAAGRQIHNALVGNLERCRQNHDLVALANTYFWADAGARYDPERRNWPADPVGCATIAVDNANLPTSLAAGGSDILQVAFAMEFFDGQKTSADFAVNFQGVGFSFSPGGGTAISRELPGGTDLTTGVDAQQGPPYGLRAQPCWFLDGIARNVCGDFTLPFESSVAPTPAVTPTATPNQGLLAPDVAGTYQVTLICANAIYGNGQANVSREQNVVSVSWSVQVTQPDSGGLCRDAASQGLFPTSGNYSGSLTTVAANQFDIMLSSWSASPCLSTSPEPKSARYDAARRAIGIPVGSCPPSSLFGSMGYNTQRVSP